MKESFLHFIWRYRRMNRELYFTTQMESLQILEGGQYNTNAGPDFLNAKLKIGDTLWVGNVEVHIKASDWYKHQHQENPAFNNVILHVVWEEDRPILHNDGSPIPCLELKPLITPKLFRSYQKLIHNPHQIPCHNLLDQVPEINKKMWLDRLQVERLENKIQYWSQQLEQSNFNWEELFFQALARNFGQPVNKSAMEILAQRTPLLLLKKHGQSLFQIEALLFGQAGLLMQDFKDKYPLQLQKEYHFLKQKYQLEEMSPVMWKFSRMRPAHFPSIRIAQLAQLVYQSNHLFSKSLAIQNIKEGLNMFELELAQYWKNHYQFDRLSNKRKNKKLGNSTKYTLLINALIPFLFLYGQLKDRPNYKDKALALLQEIPAENNKLLRDWKTRGWSPENAAESQALLELYKGYCLKKRCLDCAIGVSLLKND